MRGNMKVSSAVATWVWWSAVVGPAWVCSFMVAEHDTLNYQNYVTEQRYALFIGTLRDRLARLEKPLGIPVTREPSTVPDSQRFVLVKLSSWTPYSRKSSATLAVDVTNAYVVAYRNGSWSFFLREDNPNSAIDNLFPHTKRYNFSFSGSYRQLEGAAHLNRVDIELGMGPLGEAIQMVVIQMVAEAVRFRYIERQVVQSITNNVHAKFRPDSIMCSLENKWRTISTAAQQLHQGRVFCRPAEVCSSSNNPVNVGSVSEREISELAIMLFVRRRDRW